MTVLSEAMRHALSVVQRYGEVRDGKELAPLMDPGVREDRLSPGSRSKMLDRLVDLGLLRHEMVTPGRGRYVVTEAGEREVG